MGNEGINRAKYIVTAVLTGIFLCACSKEEAVETKPLPPATQSVPVIEEARETTRIITDPVGYDTGEEMIVPCKGIFPYIGADPCTGFVDARILDERGYILANPDMSTAIKGIYGAGDCIKKDLRQVVTACNDGAIAANSIIKYLKE